MYVYVDICMCVCVCVCVCCLVRGRGGEVCLGDVLCLHLVILEGFWGVQGLEM